MPTGEEAVGEGRHDKRCRNVGLIQIKKDGCGNYRQTKPDAGLDKRGQQDRRNDDEKLDFDGQHSRMTFGSSFAGDTSRNMALMVTLLPGGTRSPAMSARGLSTWR